jgi:hypothetical protein
MSILLFRDTRCYYKLPSRINCVMYLQTCVKKVLCIKNVSYKFSNYKRAND